MFRQHNDRPFECRGGSPKIPARPMLEYSRAADAGAQGVNGSFRHQFVGTLIAKSRLDTHTMHPDARRGGYEGRIGQD